MDILQTLYRKNPHMLHCDQCHQHGDDCGASGSIGSVSCGGRGNPADADQRVKKLGNYHLPQAENPVWICSFTFREGETGSMDKVKKALLTEEENGNRENGEVQR